MKHLAGPVAGSPHHSGDEPAYAIDSALSGRETRAATMVNSTEAVMGWVSRTGCLRCGRSSAAGCGQEGTRRLRSVVEGGRTEGG